MSRAKTERRKIWRSGSDSSGTSHWLGEVIRIPLGGRDDECHQPRREIDLRPGPGDRIAGRAIRVPERGVRGQPGASRGGRGPAPRDGGRRRFHEAAGADRLGHDRPRPDSGRARHADRAVPALAADRRGRHGRRLHGRAGAARPPQGRAQDHQAGDGQRPGRRPVRSRAPGPGRDGPHQHRQGLRRRHHRDRPALLRHGAGPRRADHEVLRRQPAHAPRAARIVRARSARRSSTRTRRGSSTATSSRRTCW